MIPERFRNTHPRAVEIAQECAAARGVDYDALFTPSRKRPLVIARREAMRRIRGELGWAIPRIGAFFKRDVATVHHHLMRGQP